MTINPKRLITEYLNQSSWRTKENSNNDYSYPSLRSHIANKVTSKFMLTDVYNTDIAEAHEKGDIHIHDLGHGLAVYCCGWSLRDLLQEGFSEMRGRANSAPPKHLRSACIQMANFLGVLQSEASGAQAFNSVDTFLAPYIKKDNLDYAEVYQCMQELIYNLNIPTRSGEIPFTNFSFDWVCPKDLYNQSPLVGGEVLDFTYGDCQPEMDIINKAFLEVMTKGDCNGRIFGFPIPTYSMTKEFDFTSENAKLLFELTAKYGSPYFQNFINSDLNPGDIRSMCCRLSLDLKQLKRRGGIFNAWDGTGSIGVVTINMPRLGYLSKGDFFDRLEELLILAKDSLVIKRKMIDELFEQGLFPYCKRWLKRGFTNHFCTIGIVGMHECLKNLYTEEKDQLTEKEGKWFVAADIMPFILERLQEFQEETGYLFNFEETPAEGCCYRFAKQDKAEFPLIFTSGDAERPYYTQGAKLPFDYTNDIFKILDHQEPIATKYTGGSVQHIFLGERISGEMAGKLIKTVLTNFKTPYITLSPTFSICHDCGFHPGEIDKCPTCDKDMEVYSRIVGYYSPTYRWNSGKQAEFEVRETYERVIYHQDITRL